MVVSSHDEAFFDLPQSLQRKIDSAFHSVVRRTSSRTRLGSEPPTKRQKLSPSDNLGGGFLVDDHTAGGGGGFLVDDQDAGVGGGFVVENASEKDIGEGGGFLVEDSEMLTDVDENPNPEAQSVQIAFSSIPTALQLLDLPPDDEQVLSVFRNAASGWDNHEGDGTDDTLAVTLKDWRAVCTILLEPGQGEDDNPGTDGGGFMSTRSGSLDDVDEASSELNVQIQSDADSDDNYQPEPSSSNRRRTRASTRGGKRRARVIRNDSDSEDYESESGSRSTRLTSRQKANCLEAFAMLFSDEDDAKPEGDLEKRRITLADLQRLTKLLGEKLKAEEMLEMLEVFSTSPDKSMGLSDFERMMVAAKLL